MTCAATITDSTRRFPGAVLSSSPAATLPRRDRVVILAGIILITVLAWAYLVHLGRAMPSGMEYDKAMAAMGMVTHSAWSATDIFYAFSMWVVMMLAMMVPSAAPVLLLFAAAQSRRGTPLATSLATFMLGLGYIAVWTGFSAGAALVQWMLHQTAMLSAAMAASSPRLAGAILIGAGIYQVTPWKGTCLTHCRSPLGFMLSSWRDGKLGALQMGFRHGTYCLGCCWALMCVLFAVGVMNLAWVAALTVFVLLEKTGPHGVAVARIAGFALIVVGIVTAA